MPDLGVTVENERAGLNVLTSKIADVKSYAANVHGTLVTDGATETASIVAAVQAGLDSFAEAESKLAEACALLNDAHNAA